MTQTPTLPGPDDRHGWHALAIRWPNLPEEIQESLKEQMNRGTWRRFERTLAKMHEDKRTFGQQYCTREDAVKINALFLEQKVMPIAANVDRLTQAVEYLMLPWWKRWWVQVVRAGLRIHDWLASKGVRLVNLETEEADEHAEDHGDLGARGDEGRADGGGPR